MLILFRAFSALHRLWFYYLGRWPRLLHFAPLALNQANHVCIFGILHAINLWQ